MQQILNLRIFTRRELAETAGVSVPTLMRAARGQAISQRSAELLSKALQIPVDLLRRGES